VKIPRRLTLRGMLEAEGLDSWPKLTGGKGLHVMASLAKPMAHDTAHAYARRLAQRLAATESELYVMVTDPARRPGRIFIDYLRNGRGTTAVGTYSPRARWGFPIARLAGGRSNVACGQTPTQCSGRSAQGETLTPAGYALRARFNPRSSLRRLPSKCPPGRHRSWDCAQ
jgi:DNA primase